MLELYIIIAIFYFVGLTIALIREFEEEGEKSFVSSVRSITYPWCAICMLNGLVFWCSVFWPAVAVWHMIQKLNDKKKEAVNS